MRKRIIRGAAVSSALLLSVTAGISTTNLVFADVDEGRAVFEFSESSSESSKTYESVRGGENVILGTDGSINFLKATISKTGNDDSEDADVSGTNAAVLSINTSTIKISDSAILTNGEHAHALFAHGDSTIDVSDSTIKTEGKNSNALMAVDGGTVISNNMTVEVMNETSVPVYVGKGGGEVKISGGNYRAVNADGIRISGKGKVTLKNVEFDMPKGDMLITNADAEIEIERTREQYGSDTDSVQKGNNDEHDFLRIEDGKTVFTSRKNPIFGDIMISKNATAELNLLERTSFEGAINAENNAKNVKVKLDEKSRIVLTKDSYISELEDSVSDNSNIFANGHKLFVNGEEAKINEEVAETWDYDFSTESTEPEEEAAERNKTGLYILLGAFSFAFMVAFFSTIAIAKNNKREKRAKIERKAVERAGSNKMKKPWEKK